MILFIIFILRNIDRIYNEIDKYNFNPIKNAHYRYHVDYFKIYKDLKTQIEDYNTCNKLRNCDEKLDIKVGKIFGKIYFLNSQ